MAPSHSLPMEFTDLEIGPLIQSINDRVCVDPHPATTRISYKCQHTNYSELGNVPRPYIHVRDAILPASGASEPIPVLETDLQYTVKSLGLIPVA
jgi:hypothetical protein